MGSDAPKVNEDVPKVAVAPAAVPIAPGVTLHTCFQVVPFCKVKVNVTKSPGYTLLFVSLRFHHGGVSTYW